MSNGNGNEELAAGAVEVTLTTDKEFVVMSFAHSVSYIAMPADQASTFAEQMARASYYAHYGQEAPGRGAELVRQIKAKAVDDVRPRLITRSAQIIRSLVRDNRTPEDIAERVVDAVLREVT